MEKEGKKKSQHFVFSYKYTWPLSKCIQNLKTGSHRSHAGLDAGFRKVGFVLDNSKQTHVKFLNIHQNSNENEVILAKMGL